MCFKPEMNVSFSHGYQANDYTVEIDQAEGLEESLDTMALTLLCTDRATDRFKNLEGQGS